MYIIMRLSLAVIVIGAILISQNEASPDSELRYLYSQTRNIRLGLESYKDQYVDQEVQKFIEIADYYRVEVDNRAQEKTREVEFLQRTGSKEDCMQVFKKELAATRCSLENYFKKFINGTVTYVKTGVSQWSDFDLTAEAAIRPNERIAELITMGKDLETRIDDIRATCSSNISVDRQKCLQQFLTGFKLSLVDYQQEDRKVRNQVESNTYLIFIMLGLDMAKRLEDWGMKEIVAKDVAEKCMTSLMDSFIAT